MFRVSASACAVGPPTNLLDAYGRVVRVAGHV